MKPVTVIGGGSWGTTLAVLLAEKGYTTRLWVRSRELCDDIKRYRENAPYLSGVNIPPNVHPTSSFEEALEKSFLVVSSVPSFGVREVFKKALPYMPPSALIVSTSKGIEGDSLLTCSAVLKDVLSEGFHKRIFILSGPTFAREVSMKLPTAASIAGESLEEAVEIQRIFSTSYFRVYTNPDPLGVELGGVLKNVIAIAAGISDGLKLGMNARAALITRGLREIARLGVGLGARPETFYGLSGLGDLVLTSTGNMSRNYTVGFEVGRGQKPKDVISSMRMVAEGVKSSLAVRELAKKHCIDMPIVEAVSKVIHEDKSPSDTVRMLMERELKGES